MSSLPLLALSLLFFSYISQSLVLTFSLQIQPTVQDYKELVWLARNLKLEVTKYSRQLYGPRGLAYSGNGDDDDNDGGGGDSETTPSY